MALVFEKRVIALLIIKIIKGQLIDQYTELWISL